MKHRKLAYVVAGALLTLHASDAKAQWSATAIGVAEYDTENTLLLLGGLSAGPGGLGWAPRVGVQGYYLRYDAGTRSVDVTSIRPYVGLRNTMPAGSASINLGYAFSNRDVVGVAGPALVTDHGEGVVLSGGWDYWGTGPEMGYQLLGAYNFGSEALWARGRATFPMQVRATSQTRLGGEVAFLSGKNYTAWQPGAVLEFTGPQGRLLAFGAGMKFFERGENAVYFKVETVLPLAR